MIQHKHGSTRGDKRFDYRSFSRYVLPRVRTYKYPSYYPKYPNYYPSYSLYPVGPFTYGAPLAVSPDVQPPQEGLPETEAGQQYFAAAQQAFRGGDYRGTLRLAGHAAVEMPHNPAIHQFTALALFALAEYRGAAEAAHVALSQGQPWDWPTLIRHYGNARNYTPQLRALESYVGKNPKAADARFLLGYHCLMMGHSAAADRHLAKAIELTPDDKLAAGLLKALRDRKSKVKPPGVSW